MIDSMFHILFTDGHDDHFLLEEVDLLRPLLDPLVGQGCTAAADQPILGLGCLGWFTATEQNHLPPKYDSGQCTKYLLSL